MLLFSNQVRACYIGDFVWNDLNNNGIQDVGEPGIPGVKVTIIQNGVTYIVYTDANGKYLKELYLLPFCVSFETPAGNYVPSPANMGGDDAKDSDNDGNPVCFTPTYIGEYLTFDAGYEMEDFPDACETAFAKSDKEVKCFIPDFARWGWTSMISPGTYEWPLWAAAGQCDTGKGKLVGSVTVVYTNGNVSVTFNLEEPNKLDETHVYAGTTEYPQVKRGKKTVSTVAPGSYYIELPADGGAIYVIAQSVVCGPYPQMKSAEIVSPVAETNNLKVYPNPFSDKLNFEFVSDKSARAVIEIFNMTGQSVTRLLDHQVEEGVMNRVEYAPTNIISGVYIYKLTIDGNTPVGRVFYRK